jgi:hypothetical protein
LSFWFTIDIKLYTTYIRRFAWQLPGKVHNNLVYLAFQCFFSFIGFFCSKKELFLDFAGEKVRKSLRTPSNCGLFALAAVACKSRRVAYHSAQDILGRQRPMLDVGFVDCVTRGGSEKK